MAVIDSDAHVLETERTWDYMLESERDYKPRVVATPDDPSSGGESWLVDGVYIGRREMSGMKHQKRARWMTSRPPQAHGRARRRRRSCIRRFFAAFYPPAGVGMGGDAELQSLARRYLEARSGAAALGGGVAVAVNG